MPQHALDYRRAGAMPPSGYETTPRSRVPADASMAARREHRARQRETSTASAALELRRRRLELLRVASG